MHAVPLAASAIWRSDFWIIRKADYRNVEAIARRADGQNPAFGAPSATCRAACEEEVGLTQAAVANALQRHQPFIANIESGDRRLDVVEFLDLARVVGFDPYEMLRGIEEVEP